MSLAVAIGVAVLGAAASSSLVNGLAGATPSGQVFGWGDNSNGALGNGTTVARQTTPVPATGLTDAVRVAGGEGFSVALRANGTVVASGANANGQLGDGTTTPHTIPAPVNGISNAVAIIEPGSPGSGPVVGGASAVHAD